MRNNRTFIVRQGTLKDLPRISRFLQQRGTRHTLERDEDALLAVLEDRTILLVEDATTRAVVGMSAMFEYLDGEYAEAGAAIVTNDIGGCGMSLLLARILIARTRILDSERELFAVVSPSNTRMVALLDEGRFFEWSDPDEELVTRYEQIHGCKLDGTSKSLFYLPATECSHHACELLSIARSDGWNGPSGGAPVIDVHRKNREKTGTEVLTFKLEVDTFTDYLPDLERLCAGDPDFYGPP